MAPQAVFMGKSRKTYSGEFKLEAVRLAAEGDRPPTHVARELGISPSMIHRWIAEVEERGSAAFSGREQPDGKAAARLVTEEEIRRLRRERDQARQERDILKKALAYFANEKS